jgi:hypothetical protein
MTNLFVGLDATAFAEPSAPPTDIAREPYLAWLASVKSAVSAFCPAALDWHEEQQSQARSTATRIACS